MQKLAKRAHFEVLQRVIWAEESKTGLEFEIGPSYDNVSKRSNVQLPDILAVPWNRPAGCGVKDVVGGPYAGG